MIGRLRERLTAERGFTLIELMMAAAIGTVVMLAAYGLLDATVRSFGSSANRTDVAQRGRLMLDEVTRQLRSPVCLSPGKTAFLDATATSFKFWSDLTGSDFKAGNPQPVVRELTMSGGVLTETTRATPTGAVTRTRQVDDRLSQIQRGATTIPYFRYWALEPAKSPPSPRKANVELAPPVAAADLPRIARVTVAFRVGSLDGNGRQAADFENEVYIRSIDQADAAGAIRCSL